MSSSCRAPTLLDNCAAHPRDIASSTTECRSTSTGEHCSTTGITVICLRTVAGGYESLFVMVVYNDMRVCRPVVPVRAKSICRILNQMSRHSCPGTVVQAQSFSRSICSPAAVHKYLLTQTVNQMANIGCRSQSFMRNLPAAVHHRMKMFTRVVVAASVLIFIKRHGS